MQADGFHAQRGGKNTEFGSRCFFTSLLFGDCIDRFGDCLQPFQGDRFAADVGKAIGSVGDFIQGAFHSRQALNAAIYKQPILLDGIEILRRILVLARFGVVRSFDRAFLFFRALGRTSERISKTSKLEPLLLDAFAVTLKKHDKQAVAGAIPQRLFAVCT